MATERLFIAITPPPAVKAVVAALATRLRDVRWTPADQLHVTLRFIGDVQTDAIPELLDRLAEIRIEPFLLPVETAGGFPPQRSPRVLWVGVGSGHPRLFQLRQQLDDTILAAGLEPDLRTFHPHITVGRCTDGASGGASQWIRTHAAFAGPSFMVESFDLFSSELHPEGATHKLIARFLLGK